LPQCTFILFQGSQKPRIYRKIPTQYWFFGFFSNKTPKKPKDPVGFIVKVIMGGFIGFIGEK